MTRTNNITMSANVHIDGKVKAEVTKQSDGVVLEIGSPGKYAHVNLFVDNLEALAAIADAIYHFKMDQDADAAQAASPAPVLCESQVR